MTNEGRTRINQIHNLVLYQLSYGHHITGHQHHFTSAGGGRALTPRLTLPLVAHPRATPNLWTPRVSRVWMAFLAERVGPDPNAKIRTNHLAGGGQPRWLHSPQNKNARKMLLFLASRYIYPIMLDTTNPIIVVYYYDYDSLPWEWRKESLLKLSEPKELTECFPVSVSIYQLHLFIIHIIFSS